MSENEVVDDVQARSRRRHVWRAGLVASLFALCFAAAGDLLAQATSAHDVAQVMVAGGLSAMLLTLYWLCVVRS